MTTGGFGSGDGELRYPEGIALAKGSLHVVDSINNRVVVFDAATLRQKFCYGGMGSAPGQFNEPYGICAHPQVKLWRDGEGAGREAIYVADQLNHRVQAFTLDGTFVRSFGHGQRGTAPGYFSFPHGLTAWEDLLIVAEESRVQVLSVKTGQPLQVFSPPGGGILWGLCLSGRESNTSAGRGYVVNRDRSILHALKIR